MPNHPNSQFLIYQTEERAIRLEGEVVWLL